MENVFTEESYRKYLENHYEVLADKFDYKKRKQIVDQYTKEELERIVEDTKEFSKFIIDELAKTEYSLIDDVFMKFELSDSTVIDTELLGGGYADELYRPDNYYEDFYVSKHLLESFFKAELKTGSAMQEIYDEKQEKTVYIEVPYAGIVMPKEDFKEYTKYRTKEKVKVKNKVSA